MKLFSIFYLLIYIYYTYAFSYGKIAVIGPTGKLGREFITELNRNNVKIKILNRHYYNTSNIDSYDIIKYYNTLKNIEIINGDINNQDSLVELLKDCNTCVALHGSNRITKFSDFFTYNYNDLTHPVNVNYRGIKKLIIAANKTNTCRHIIRISGNGENPFSFISIIINFFGSMTKPWNYAGEYLLRNNKYGIDYTIIRPGIMTYDDDKYFSYKLSDNGKKIPVSKISYNSIAKLCFNCISNPNVKNTTLTAMTVKEGYGSLGWSSLLQNVNKDNRFFPHPKNIIIKHYIANGIFIYLSFIFIYKILKYLIFF